MILYFTGTGNSRLVANVLAKELCDTAVSLNDIIKEDQEWKFESKTPFILVSPIYAWRIPKKIEIMLQEGEFVGNKNFYLVATMGTNSGIADAYVKKIIEGKGMTFMGYRGIPMPDNYVVSDTMMSKEDALAKINQSIPNIHDIATLIGQGYPIHRNDHMKFARLCSGIVNWGFNLIEVTSKHFTVSDECVMCGKCINECPTNNISVGLDKKITYGKDCMFCLGCIQKCPKQAIDYKRRTKKNGRYVCPDLDKLNNTND